MVGGRLVRGGSVQGFGFRVSGFGLRDSGFGFKVQDFGISGCYVADIAGGFADIADGGRVLLRAFPASCGRVHLLQHACFRVGTSARLPPGWDLRVKAVGFRV